MARRVVTALLYPSAIRAPSTRTSTNNTQENIALLEPHCAEFLIHAADVEGKQAGIDTELVELLSSICTIPVTYAGGGRHLQDLELVKTLSGGKIDLTIGSALDIFGGSGIKFEEAVAWNGEQ
jgi:phosphoribosylformimino-5-aminoimidazole carboxamide ribotide isomerase